MTVKELKSVLEGIPDYMDILIDNDEFELLIKAEVRPVKFEGSPYEFATVDCLVLQM